MPFGLQGAPATFQRMMDELLRGTEGYSAAYLDDIVIYSDNWKDHMKHSKDVFRRLKKAALTVKLISASSGWSNAYILDIWWERNCEARKLQTGGSQGLSDSKDKDGGEGVSRFGGLLLEIYPEFCGDSSA